MKEEQETGFMHDLGRGKTRESCGLSEPARWRSVLFQRSTWALPPLCLPTVGCCSSAMTEAETFKKSRLALALAILLCNGFPQALARLAGCDPQRHTPRLDGS